MLSPVETILCQRDPLLSHQETLQGCRPMLPLMIWVEPSDPTALPWVLGKSLPQGQASYIVGPTGFAPPKTVSEDPKDSCPRQ